MLFRSFPPSASMTQLAWHLKPKLYLYCLQQTVKVATTATFNHKCTGVPVRNSYHSGEQALALLQISGKLGNKTSQGFPQGKKVEQ